MIGITNEYQKHGVKNFYQQYSLTYQNPHEPIIKHLLQTLYPKLDTSKVLDLACGNGEVTKVLQQLGVKQISGVDPYLKEAYEKQTGKKCLNLSFEDIAQGKLNEQFSLIVCSFALHLLEPSYLPNLVNNLSYMSPVLVIITPHKRPQIKSEWGFNLEQEILFQRVRARVYSSQN